MIELAITRLRRIALAVDRGEPPSAGDAAWFADAVRRYEAGASNGLTLERALGLAREPGQEAWWTVEARSKRNETIRALRKHCPDFGITEAARWIAKLGADYQARAWRNGTPRPSSDPKKQLIASALETGLPFPKARHVENILRNES